MKKFFKRLRALFNYKDKSLKAEEKVVHIGIVRDKYGRTKVYLDGTEYKRSNSTIEVWARSDYLNKVSWEIRNVKS